MRRLLRHYSKSQIDTSHPAERRVFGFLGAYKSKGLLLLVLVPLTLALACVALTFTLAVITDAVVAFALVRFLVGVVVIVFLVVVLMAMVAMISRKQNFTCLNIGQSTHS